MNRRAFLIGVGVLGGAAALPGCGVRSDTSAAPGASTPTPHAPAAADGASVHVDFAARRRLPDGFSVIDRRRNRTGAQVRDGALTHGAPTASGAALYVCSRVPGRAVTRIGVAARFVDRDRSGSIALVVGSAPVPADESADAPSAGVHFVANPSGWTYGVWDAGASGQDVIARGVYRAPITLTDARFEVVLDGSTATVVLPDGTAVNVTDPRIEANRGASATWELYENGADQTPAEITEMWAA